MVACVQTDPLIPLTMPSAFTNSLICRGSLTLNFTLNFTSASGLAISFAILAGRLNRRDTGPTRRFAFNTPTETHRFLCGIRQRPRDSVDSSVRLKHHRHVDPQLPCRPSSPSAHSV